MAMFDPEAEMIEDCIVVFFDMETTGLDTARCHILQLAAISGEREFNVFISPCRDIDANATLVNGFTTHKRPGFHRRSLRLHGQPVATVPLMHALTDFIDFLSSFEAPLLLAAHNAQGFDHRVLINSLQRCSLVESFLDVATDGFLDTLTLSRELRLTRNHNLVNLVRRFLPHVTHNSHDAQEDAWVLQELYKQWKWEVDSWQFIDAVNECRFFD